MTHPVIREIVDEINKNPAQFIAYGLAQDFKHPKAMQTKFTSLLTAIREHLKSLLDDNPDLHDHNSHYIADFILNNVKTLPEYKQLVRSVHSKKAREAVFTLEDTVRKTLRLEHTGEDLYKWLSGLMYFGDWTTYKKNSHIADIGASDYLNSKGIPGHRFWDMGSRSEGQGTHNYVIWDLTKIKMVGIHPNSDVDAIDYFNKYKQYSETFGEADEMLTPDMLNERIKNAQSDSNPESYNQIIGIKGARKLDAANGNTVLINNLNVAKLMEARNLNRDKIWFATGWIRGVDGQWKYEIPDGKLKSEKDVKKAFASFIRHSLSPKFQQAILNNGYKPIFLNNPVKLKDIFDAPELYKAYPNLEKFYVDVAPLPDNLYAITNTMSVVFPKLGAQIVLNINALNNFNHNAMQKAMLHEIQHVIQLIEGFAFGNDLSTEAKTKFKEILNFINDYGGNFKYHMLAIVNALQDKNINAAKNIAYGLPKEFRSVAAKIIRDFAGFLDASEDYIFSAGEAEARNIVAREHLTPEQRRYTPPYKTSDVPQDKQIPTYLHVSDDSVSDLLGKPETYDQSFNNNVRPADSFLSPEGQKQIERVRKKYQGTEQWMKAPNGKKTKLTEFQWLQVRTPNFKRWFGDWENHPENASKVLDENGEPLVLYHQTENVFSVFDVKHKGAGSTDYQTPFGIFLKPTDENIGIRGDIQMPLFANIRNPITFNNRNSIYYILSKFINSSLAKDYQNAVDNFMASDKKFADEFDELDKLWDHQYYKGNTTQEKTLQEKIDELLEEWEKTGDNLGKAVKQILTDLLCDLGYDGFILENDTGSFGRKTKTIIALYPNQAKSATRNNGEFSEKPEIYQQIIGELGARNLDLAEGSYTHMDNLLKAKIMRKNKISPKNIKLATGWEFAPDGKWRFEIQDAYINSKALFDAINTYGENLPFSMKLHELYNNNHLFNAYPELKNLPVIFKQNISDGKNNTLGIYVHGDDKHIELKAISSIEKLRSVLIHEIQHAVQDIEGFAQGGYGSLSVIKGKQAISIGKKFLHALLHTSTPNVRKAARLFMKGDTDKANNIADNMLPAEKGIWKRVLRTINDINRSQFRTNTYNYLGGEIEARNAETRADFSDEQRHNNTLASTQDSNDWLVVQDNIPQNFSIIQDFSDDKHNMPDIKTKDLNLDNTPDNFISDKLVEKYNQDNWHGTGHIIKNNKFDLRYVGSGEGHQSYGYGIYSAEVKNVANEYRREGLDDDDNYSPKAKFEFTLNDGSIIVYGDDSYRDDYFENELLKRITDKINSYIPFNFIGNYKDFNDLLKQNFDELISETIKHFIHEQEYTINFFTPDMTDTHDFNEEHGRNIAQSMIEFATRAIETTKRFHPVSVRILEFQKPNAGNIYRVDVPENWEVLDWDKKLKQQPEYIINIMRRFMRNFDRVNMTGEDFYWWLSDKLGSPKKASMWLLKQGIPGLRYLDGWSRKNGEGTYNFVTWDMNRIKLVDIDDSSDSDAINYFRRTSKTQSTSGFESYNQIIGEKGAIAIDAANGNTNLMDNLEVAKQMRQAGKDAKTIRLATGWEMGSDNNWKYEIPDGNLRPDCIFDWHKDGVLSYFTTNLGDIFDAPELFNAYPKLKSLPVSATISDIANPANYNNDFGHPKIEINKLYVDQNNGKIIPSPNELHPRLRNLFPDLRTSLLHEIQHAVQNIEGFPGGSNMGYWAERNFIETQEKREKLLQKLKQQRKNIENISGFDEYDKSLSIDMDWAEYDEKVNAFWENSPYNEEYKRLNQRIRDIIGVLQSDTLEKQYLRAQGEREARNTETRQNFSDEQRRNTLLSETEDDKGRFKDENGRFIDEFDLDELDYELDNEAYYQNSRANEIYSQQNTFVSRYSFSDDETEKQFSEAKRKSNPADNKKSLKDYLLDALHGLSGDSPELATKQAKQKDLIYAREVLRMLKRKSDAQIQMAVHSLCKSLDALSPEQFDIFTRMLLINDIYAFKRQNPNAPLPLGFTYDSLKAERIRFSKLIQNQPEVLKAAQDEANLNSKIKNELASLARELGLQKLADKVSNSEFNSAMLDYANIISPNHNNINANYIHAMGTFRAQQLQDILRLQAIRDIKAKYDIKDKLIRQFGSQWGLHIPNGYKSFNILAGHFIGAAHSLHENILGKALEATAQQLGLSDETIKHLRESVSEKSGSQLLVLPNEIVDSIHYMLKPKHRGPFSKILRYITGAWKKLVLYLPTRVAKYNLRNLTGDLDAVIAGNPNALKFLKQAVSELYDAYLGDSKNITPELLEFQKRGGAITTETSQELYDYHKLKQFKHLVDAIDEKNPEAWKHLPQKAWDLIDKFAWSGVQNLTDFREAWLRYACYLSYLHQMQNNLEGEPDNWGASVPDEVMSIPDIRDRAFKMSNELLGAYDQVSQTGQALRELFIPFYSWLEVNAKRYYQLLKNGFASDKPVDFMIRSLEGLSIKSHVYAYRIGKTLFMVNLLALLVKAFNHFVWPDDEDKLPPDIKERPHITLGHDPVTGDVLYFDRIGAIADNLEWFRGDAFFSDIKAILYGKLSVTQWVKMLLAAPVNKIMQGINPIFKAPFELATGKSLYPDFTNPRNIQDKFKYIAQSLGLNWPFKIISGEPHSTWDEFRNLFVYGTDADEAAYFYTLNLVRQFRENVLGKRSGGFSYSQKGLALQNLKRALRLDDKDAINRYLQDYFRLNGNNKGLKASLRNLNPLHSLSKHEQAQFLNWISDDDRIYFDRANIYVQTLLERFSER